MKSGPSKTAPSPTPAPTTSTAISTPTCSAKAQVLIWLLEGNRNEDIAQAIKDRWPAEDPAALLNSAGDHFAEVAQADTTIIRGWCLDALRELYRRQIDIGDYAGALKAVKELMSYAKACSKQQNDPPPLEGSTPSEPETLPESGKNPPPAARS